MGLSIEEIVEGGLCIGCGLCQAIAGRDRISLVLTPEGRERLDLPTLDTINAVCPGVRVEGAQPVERSAAAARDLIWGSAARLAIGYAKDPTVRYKASTGGVLTALGQFILDTGMAKLILHVAASKLDPMRTHRHLRFDSASVLEGAGSRYGPAAPLADFNRSSTGASLLR